MIGRLSGEEIERSVRHVLNTGLACDILNTWSLVTCHDAHGSSLVPASESLLHCFLVTRTKAFAYLSRFLMTEWQHVVLYPQIMPRL